MTTCNQKPKILFVLSGVSTLTQLEATMIGKYFFHLSRVAEVKTALITKPDLNQTAHQSIRYISQPNWVKHSGLFLTLFSTYQYLKWMKAEKFDLVVLSGAPARIKIIFLFPILRPNEKYAILMATPSVNKQKWMRWFLDSIIKFNLLFFNNILIPPTWPFDRFYFSKRKARYYELGFFDYGFKDKSLDSLRLVYVGYVRGRDIDKTIMGLSMFLASNPEASISYDIVGKDDPETAQKMKGLIYELNLQSIVSYHGFQPTDRLALIVQNANVGVCFVPQCIQFEHTSTKTLEYLIAGLPVIGTYSEFRSKYVNDSTGVLHQDTPEAFASALASVYENRFKYDARAIRDSHIKYSISAMIESSFLSALQGIISE